MIVARKYVSNFHERVSIMSPLDGSILTPLPLSNSKDLA